MTATRPNATERRMSPRVSLLGGLLPELLVAELAKLSGGLILDLGAEGMSVQLVGPVPPLPQFTVRFTLEYGAAPIEATGRLAWTDGDQRVGISLVDIPAASREQLSLWLDSKRHAEHTEINSEASSAEALISRTEHLPNQNEKKTDLTSKLARAYTTIRAHEQADLSPATPLSFEELASTQPSAAATDVVRADNESIVPCGDCGYSNPSFTRFCGMCGADLRSPSAIGADLAKEVRQTRPEISPVPAEIRKMLAESPAKPTPDRMTVVLLVLLLVLLSVVIAQQWSLWRGPVSAGWNRGSSASDSPQPTLAGNQPRTSKAAVDSRPGIPGRRPPVHSPGPAAISSKAASKAVPKLSPKTARDEKLRPRVNEKPRVHENETESATTVKRTLEGPAPLTSPMQQKELPLSAVPAISDSAPQPKEGRDVGASAQRRQISQGVAAGALIYKVFPDYPSVARSAHVQGNVVLRGVIAKNGTVQELRVLQGSPLLIGPAMDAVKKWRYRPYVLNGRPVEVETTITLQFKNEE